MKSLLIASTALLNIALYAQDTAMANADSAIINYSLNEIIIADEVPDVLLGELNNKKTKRGQAITSNSKVAYYFENTTKENGIYLKSMLFKVEKVKYKTEARIRLYKKHDYVVDSYHPETGANISYNSFIPGEQITAGEIVVYIEPGQKGIVEVNLMEYGITMPAEGLFLSLEGVGYYDADGNRIENLKSKELTRIDFHPTTTDNYCSWISPLGTQNWYWINPNKLLKVDYKEVLKQKTPKKSLIAPNFGLKVIMPKLKF